MANYIWPEITKDTPIEEVKRIHQRIWDYAIEYGTKPVTPYASFCAACAYIKARLELCKDCPIIWPNGKCFGGRYGDGYLYSEWFNSTDKQKTELARQIRDLPWKFESNH